MTDQFETKQSGDTVVIATRIDKDFQERVRRACKARGYRNMSQFVLQAVIDLVHDVESKVSQPIAN